MLLIRHRLYILLLRTRLLRVPSVYDVETHRLYPSFRYQNPLFPHGPALPSFPLTLRRILTETPRNIFEQKHLSYKSTLPPASTSRPTIPYLGKMSSSDPLASWKICTLLKRLPAFSHAFTVSTQPPTSLPRIPPVPVALVEPFVLPLSRP